MVGRNFFWKRDSYEVGNTKEEEDSGRESECWGGSFEGALIWLKFVLVPTSLLHQKPVIQ